MKDKEYLINLLALSLASGKVDPQYILPVIKQLAEGADEPVAIPDRWSSCRTISIPSSSC